MAWDPHTLRAEIQREFTAHEESAQDYDGRWDWNVLGIRAEAPRGARRYVSKPIPPRVTAPRIARKRQGLSRPWRCRCRHHRGQLHFPFFHAPNV